MGLGPIGATRKALSRAGIGIDDVDVIEINEAFSSQALACISDLSIDRAKVNLDGGALALGHPLSATGSDLKPKAAALLQREGGASGIEHAVHWWWPPRVSRPFWQQCKSVLGAYGDEKLMLCMRAGPPASLQPIRPQRGVWRRNQTGTDIWEWTWTPKKSA